MKKMILSTSKLYIFQSNTPAACCGDKNIPVTAGKLLDA